MITHHAIRRLYIVQPFQLLQRLVLLACPLALCLLLLFPGVSEAHAILLRSDPSHDAILSSAPTRVRMWFSEDLNATFSTAAVVNASNQRVDLKDAHVASNDRREIDVSLQPTLPASVYVVIWESQSADDGHVLRGSFIFSVAEPDGTVPKLNGATPGQNVFGGVTSTDVATGRLDGPMLVSLLAITLVELGVVFWVGAQLWHSFVLELVTAENEEQQAIYQQTEQRFARMLALPTLLLVFLANIGVLIGQGLSLTGGNVAQSLSPALLVGLVSTGQFGTFWILRQSVVVLASILAVYVLLVKQPSARVNSVIGRANLLLALALLLAMVLSGHAAAVSSDILVYAVLSDWLHLLAAALWVGGMLFIATAYLPVLKGNAWLEQTRSLLNTLPRYSLLAITGVLIMSLSGPFNATVHMTSWSQLLATAYGRVLTVKVLLVGALLLTSAVHVFLLRPRLAKTYKTYSTLVSEEEVKKVKEVQNTAEEVKLLEGRVAQQTQRLIRVLRWEPLLGVAVLLCTGLLTVFAGTLLPALPAGQTQPVATVKPFHATIKTTDNKFTVNLIVSPNRFGPNVFTVSVLDSNGKSDTNVGVSLYTTMLDMDMGTNSVNLQPDGKGGFSVNGDLDMNGNWRIRVQIRAPNNTLHEASVNLFTPL